MASREPPAKLHDRLAARDPGMARRLRPSDMQRILRALEVVEASGRSLSDWQADPRQRVPLPAKVSGLALVPPASTVNPRIEVRLRAMIDAEALAEVSDLLTRRPDATALPIAKVHGMRELTAVIAGTLPMAAALPAIAAQIRGYAKRQRTWFRHQLPQLAPCLNVGEDPRSLALAADLAASVDLARPAH